MPRYIDADALLEELKSRKLIFEESTLVEEAIAEQCSVFEEAIEEAPTADVVPKSEVERLEKEVDGLKKDNEYILMQHRFQRRPSGDCWNDVIEKAKSEVAKEIFTEIEKWLGDYDGLKIITLEKYFEVKEKYTEGNDV